MLKTTRKKTKRKVRKVTLQNIDIMGMTPLQQKIIKLRRKGLTYWEIAEKADCSENYVYRTFARNGLTGSREKK